MSHFKSFFEPFHRGLARQVEHLRGRLDQLCHRLRDSIVQAVAEATARAVSETLTALTGQPVGRFPAHDYGRPPPSALWHNDRDYDGWHDDVDEPGYVEEAIRSVPTSSSGRLKTALTLGLRIAAWALQRAGRFCFPIAIGTGLLAAVVTYAGGPIVGAGAGCIGSLACLLTLDPGVPAEAERCAAIAAW